MQVEKRTAKTLIIEKALEMYNAYGIEYVGVRELAKELGLKAGNITYYYPTKDDIILAIYNEYSHAITAQIPSDVEVSIYNFLQIQHGIYVAQYQYRALFISMPLLVMQNEALASDFRNRQAQLNKTIYQQLKSLFLAGYFQTAKSRDLDTVLHAISATNLFWISEATIEAVIDDEELALSTYLFRLAGLLHIIASDTGKADIKRFLNELDKEES